MPVNSEQTTNWNDLVTTTLQNRRKDFIDQIFQSNVLLYELKKSLEMISGGQQIVRELMYRKNSTARSYDGADLIDLTPQEGLTAVIYNWKQHAVSVVITGKEKRQNNGPSQAYSLINARIKQAQMSASEDISQMLNADGSGNGGKDFLGIQSLIDSDATWAGAKVLGGIDRGQGLGAGASNPWWRNFNNSNLDGTPAAVPFAASGLKHMRRMWNLCSRGFGGKNRNPSLIYTTEANFERYEAEQLPHVRHEVKEMSDLGFTSLAFKKAPVVHSEQAPGGNMYFINREFIQLILHPQANFTLEEGIKPANQDLVVQKLLTMGQLTMNQARKHGVISGITD